MKERIAAGFVSGLLFGLGLAVSGMIHPQKVLGFLDLLGTWDPSLALVMGGALLVTSPAYHFILKRKRPILDSSFALPSVSKLDPKLLGGAALFGIGWGLAGLCPGPAIGVLPLAAGDAFFFFVPMLLAVYGMRRFAG